MKKIVTVNITSSKQPFAQVSPRLLLKWSPTNRFDLALFNVRATGVDVDHLLAQTPSLSQSNGILRPHKPFPVPSYSLLVAKAHEHQKSHQLWPPPKCCCDCDKLRNSTRLSSAIEDLGTTIAFPQARENCCRYLAPLFQVGIGQPKPGDWAQLLGTRLVVNCMIESTYHSTKSRGLNPRLRPQLGGSV